jgi:hypothetical protein
VEGQQCPELTSTNRSIGLILLQRSIARSGKPEDTKPNRFTQNHPQKLNTQKEPLDDLVAIARGNTPDPIPNSAVKTLRANGTAPQDAGE